LVEGHRFAAVAAEVQICVDLGHLILRTGGILHYKIERLFYSIK
jgi:hypothetical protein